MCLLLHLALLCLSFIESAGWNHVAVCSNIMLHKLSECFLCACHSRFHKLLRYSCPLVPSFPSVSAFLFWSWARVFMCELIAVSTACSSFRLWRLKSAFMYNLNYLFFLLTPICSDLWAFMWLKIGLCARLFWRGVVVGYQAMLFLFWLSFHPCSGVFYV